MTLDSAILSALAGAVFGAGGLVMLLRLLKRDVDGLGTRVRLNEEKRVKGIISQLVITDSRKDREALAKSLD